MKILYLCPKHFYDTKMSRVRFQSMEAVSKVSDFVWSGNGWDNYDNNKTVQENIDRIYGKKGPDVVVAYKPLEFNGFKNISYPKCLRYNEMWDRKWTTREIIESGSNLVICHHKNDMLKYVGMRGVKFYNISHCAEKTIYKDYCLSKKYDILLTGAISSHYPFRSRLKRLMTQSSLRDLVNCKVLRHPGDVGVPYSEIEGYTLGRYAKILNQSKISVTCSSKHKYRLGKYVEIPMCRSLLAADLPNEDKEFFKKFMLVIEPLMTNDQIIDKLVEYVRDDSKRNSLVEKGFELNHKMYTQENYAKRFVDALGDFLS